MAEIILLNRIRVDIGNVSGSLSELLQYASMAGFNDNYEPQAKPRLVGTWTINNWYTTAQLAQAQAAFDGLTIVEDPNYVIDFSQLAVQTLDDTQPNYNPAVAIILQATGYGIVLPDSVVSGQKGKYMLKKSEASSIISNSQYSDFNTYFKNKTSVTDTNGIVSNDVSISYKFESFNEFKWFTGVSVLHDAFFGCSELISIILPDTIISLLGGNGGDSVFSQCSKLSFVNIPNSLQILGNFTFRRCPSLNIGLEFPSSVTQFMARCFNDGNPLTQISYIHITNEIPFTIATGSYGSFNQYNNKIYVGDGSSALHDNAILEDYLANTDWATVSSQLDTWYNYLHPQS